MAINLESISKKINLNLDQVPEDKRDEVKQEVGEYVLEEILRAVSSAKSPVEGGAYKATLTSEYADREKGGNTKANLELDGDMLDSLEYIPLENGVEIGIFDPGEVPKADGHNNFSGQSKLPTRQFIPKENQQFKSNIENGIQSIVDEYKVTKRDIDPFKSIFTVEEAATTAIAVGDLFSDDFLEDYLTSEGII